MRVILLVAAFLFSTACNDDAERAARVAAELEAIRLQSELELARAELAARQVPSEPSTATADDEALAAEIEAFTRETEAQQAARQREETAERERREQLARQQQAARVELERQRAIAAVREELQQRLAQERRAPAAADDAPRYDAPAASARTRPPFVGTPRMSREVSGIRVTVNVHNPADVPQHANVELTVYRDGRPDRSETVGVDLAPRQIFRLDHLVDVNFDGPDQMSVGARIR